MPRCIGLLAVGAIVLGLPGCALPFWHRVTTTATGRTFTSRALVHGKPLDLHVSVPLAAAAPDVLVLYASGDGGWFGTAIDMFRAIADDGYPVVGFSSRSFLRIDRADGSLVTTAQLATEYQQIIASARRAVGLADSGRVVLTGWSRGAAFSVLVGAEPAMQPQLRGVVAIGLSEGEDLQASEAGDAGDEDAAVAPGRRWPFEPYARIAHVAPLPCAVIQATHDNYFPAAPAQRLFGPDTSLRRFYSVPATNHRFSGGKAAFVAALRDALQWMAPPPAASSRTTR